MKTFLNIIICVTLIVGVLCEIVGWETANPTLFGITILCLIIATTSIWILNQINKCKK